MIVDRWCVQLGAIWDWYLPLCIYKLFALLLCISSFSGFFFFYNIRM